MSSKNNLQETFFNKLRKERVPVSMFLVNGVKLQGVISWFDNFCVLLKRHDTCQMIYKHAISTVIPDRPVAFYEPSQEDDVSQDDADHHM